MKVKLLELQKGGSRSLKLVQRWSQIPTSSYLPHLKKHVTPLLWCIFITAEQVKEDPLWVLPRLLLSGSTRTHTAKVLGPFNSNSPHPTIKEAHESGMLP